MAKESELLWLSHYMLCGKDLQELLRSLVSASVEFFLVS